MSTPYAPFSADGAEVRWRTWDGAHVETATVRWENEGWTIGGIVGRERIQYAIRTSATDVRANFAQVLREWLPGFAGTD